MDADELFERIAYGLRQKRAVTESRMFDARVLKVQSRVFAMLVKGVLVVKLPPERVSRLLAEGRGQPFDPGHGRIMKGWITIPVERRGTWAALAGEAQEFVASESASGSHRSRSRRRTS